MKSAIEKTIWDNVSECDVDASSKGVVSKEPPKKVTSEPNQRSRRTSLAKTQGKDIQGRARASAKSLEWHTLDRFEGHGESQCGCNIWMRKKVVTQDGGIYSHDEKLGLYLEWKEYSQSSALTVQCSPLS